MFESPGKLVLGLITGVVFGFLLQKGQVAKYQTILGQLLLKNWIVLKIMLTAIVVGAAGVYALLEIGATKLDVWPLQLGGILAGALAFGIGLAIFGYCPGTSLTASGEGSRDAMVGVLGMLVGAGVFVAAYRWLQPIIHGLGDHGAITLPQLLGTSPWLVMIVLAAVGAITLGAIERYERRTARRSAPPGEAPPGRDWFEGPGRLAPR